MLVGLGDHIRAQALSLPIERMRHGFDIAGFGTRQLGISCSVIDNRARFAIFSTS
jgi:hypothetical protein